MTAPSYSSLPSRAGLEQIVSIQSVDTAAMTAMGLTRQNSYLIIDLRYHVGAIHTIPCQFDQWIIRRFGKAWILDSQLPFNTTNLLPDPEPGLTQVGSTGPTQGPLHLNGTTIAANAPVQLNNSSTTDRPAANAAGAGALIYDTTLSTPVYSNGSTWESVVTPSSGPVIRATQSTAPSTTGWNSGDFWVDTSNLPTALTLRLWNGTAFTPAVVPFGATGGTVTEVSGYRIHTFTTNGTLQFTQSGVADILTVGGGGGAGGSGGGAGGVVYETGVAVDVNLLTVTVGLGSAGISAAGTAVAASGGDTTISSATVTQTAHGGGGGTTNEEVGGNGASGGGGGASASVRAGGTGLSGEGHAGGSNVYTSTPYPSGGGGGAGAVGGDATSATVAGVGGVGVAVSISGTSTYYGGGGAGAPYYTSATTSSGGLGGGGNGNQTTPQNGTNGLGGGGGGTINTGSGGSGGKGVVIVRYLIP